MVECSLIFSKYVVIILLISVNLVLFQFDAVENGMHTSKMMQVFSKQAPMMDALISHFAEQTRRRKLGENGQPPETVTEGIYLSMKTI